MSDHIMETYSRLPVAFNRGAGALLWDESGRDYLDALSGIAVCGLGHSHPDVAAAIAEQAAILVHTSNLYRIPLQEALAARLCTISGMDEVFFCNSGAEANEAAIKLARKLGDQRGIREPQIVVMEGSFHGRTMATLSATGNRKVHAGFEPLVPGFLRVPYNNIEAVSALATQRQDIVAVLVEPVQGEGGVRIPEPGYLAHLREVCDSLGWLLMADEVQTGIARTGQWLACQHERIVPDVLTLAKGLGNGVPIGACLARGPAAGVLTPGSHGSTFGGNPLACRAALATLDVCARDGLADRASELGVRLLRALSAELAGRPGVVEIRGKGLMLAIELDRPCGRLVEDALQEGLLINVAAERTVRLLPPLILSDEQADQIVAKLCPLIIRFLAP